MPKKKSPIVSKQTRYRVNQNGKRVKSGIDFVRADGTTGTLLNPSGKAAKYAFELKRNTRYTNAGKVKRDGAGNSLSLGDEQRAYRSGYLDSQKDNAKVYKAKRAKRTTSKK